MNLKPAYRIPSIDLLRGLIMIIMALDHTRDYFHRDAFVFDPLDPEKTTAILYFTRWITHFCAPIFILLAGTSAFLSGRRKTKKEQAIFLIKRGIWLVLLELTLVNFFWFFNIHFNFFIFGVIWVLGLSMIGLAALSFLPRNAILLISLVMIFGHNLLDPIRTSGNNLTDLLWGILHQRKKFTAGDLTILEGYTLIPWMGVMALGYCIGNWFTPDFDPAKRKKILLRLGLLCWALFLVIRYINVYGNLTPWSSLNSLEKTLFSFFDLTKYPPSLDYLLVTEGGAFIFLALTEHAEGRLSKIISVYGRVPMFYYLAHILLIHLLAMFAASVTGYSWSDMTGLHTWVDAAPNLQGYGFNLGTVYFIWISLVVLLYFPCRAYDRYKQAHKEKWWLSYL